MDKSTREEEGDGDEIGMHFSSVGKLCIAVMQSELSTFNFIVGVILRSLVTETHSFRTLEFTVDMSPSYRFTFN